MWRWWIAAGLVVMALGVVGMVMVASYSGGPGPIPCADRLVREHVSGEFRSTFASRLDVDFGETVRLVMEVTNTSNRKQTIGLRGSPVFEFRVTTSFCEEVLQSPPWFEAVDGGLDFEPGETHRFIGNWNLTDSWGEAIPPGDYIAYVSIRARYPTQRQTGGFWHTVFKRIRVGEHHLRAVRPSHPPMPVYTPGCGGTVSGMYVRWVMENHIDMLEEWRGRSEVVGVIDANVLDENSMPTGMLGIRVVVYWPPWWPEPLKRWTPDCLDGVPVQFVMRP